MAVITAQDLLGFTVAELQAIRSLYLTGISSNPDIINYNIAARGVGKATPSERLQIAAAAAIAIELKQGGVQQTAYADMSNTSG